MLNKVKFLFRCCGCCGASAGITDWLCRPCYGRLFDRLNPSYRLIDARVDHYSLFDWHPEDRFLSQIVYSLKGGRLNRAYGMLAQLMFSNFPIPRVGVIYYPSKGSKDHASTLALHIGGRLSRPTHEIRAKRQGVKQAHLRKNKRLKQAYTAIGIPGTSPLLVDDVVTTGGTVMGCHKALGQQLNLTAWSLFYRKSL